MICPKCKARVGVMKKEIVLESGVVTFACCVICGYWSHPHAQYSLNQRSSQSQATM
jgi:hypothetical protein